MVCLPQPRTHTNTHTTTTHIILVRAHFISDTVKLRKWVFWEQRLYQVNQYMQIRYNAIVFTWQIDFAMFSEVVSI